MILNFADERNNEVLDVNQDLEIQIIKVNPHNSSESINEDQSQSLLSESGKSNQVRPNSGVFQSKDNDIKLYEAQVENIPVSSSALDQNLLDQLQFGLI